VLSFVNRIGGSRRWLITVTVRLISTRVVVWKSVDDMHIIPCSLCDSCAQCNLCVFVNAVCAGDQCTCETTPGRKRRSTVT